MYESCYIAFFMFLMSVRTTFIDWGMFRSFTSFLTCHLASPVFAFVLFCVFVQLTVSLATFLFQSVWSQWRRGNGLSVSPEHDVADRKWHHRSAWFVVYCQRRDFWTGKSAGPWLQVIFFVIAVLCLNVVIINTPSTSEEILFFWLWLRSVVKFAWYLNWWSTAPTTAQYRKVMG